MTSIMLPLSEKTQCEDNERCPRVSGFILTPVWEYRSAVVLGNINLDYNKTDYQNINHSVK